MKTSENAPRARRSVTKAASSTPPGPAPPGGLANSAVSTSVSEVAAGAARNGPPTGPPAPCSRACASRAASSSVLIRLPLWPRATPPVAVARNVGWALSQTEEPVVE